MRTFVKLLMPVMAFAFASAGAVSTNEAKISDAKKPLITGFIQNPTPLNCLAVSVDCNTPVTAQVCMSSESVPRQVWKKNSANACSDNLYKVFH
jgi:hypothetical protein